MANTDSRQNSFAPHLALLTVQIFFGSFPVVGKFVLLAFPSLAVVALRVGCAALFFAVLQIFNGGLKLERRKDYWLMAVYALLGVILNQLLSVTGLSLTTATNSALLAVTIPIFAAFVSTIFGFDKLTWLKICGIALAAFGVINLIDPARASFSSATTRGDLMIIVNSLCYGSYIAVSKDVIQRNGALRSLAWLFLFGAIVCVPLGAMQLVTVDFAAVTTNSWLALGFLILFSTITAYYLNAWALARVEPSIVAVYIYLQPLIGFALAVSFLGEQFTWRAVIAGILIFAGVFLVTRKRRFNNSEAFAHTTLH